ncbi:MAG: hypothetical protein ABI743_06295, partial [bacterium]
VGAKAATLTLMTGIVIVQGATNKPPGSVPQPAIGNVNGGVKSNEVAMLDLTSTRSPAAPTRQCLVRLRDNRSTVFSQFIATPSAGGLSQGAQLLADHPSPLTLSLYNSVGGPIWPEAVTWNYRLRTRSKNDTNEPNDDENGATIADLGLAERISLGRSYTRSFYRSLTISSDRDQEDWYRLDLPGGSQYQFDFPTVAGGATMNLSGTLFNGLNQQVSSVSSGGTYWVLPTAGGTYSLQLKVDALSPALTARYQKGSTIAFAEYTLAVKSNGLAPEVRTHVIAGGFTQEPSAIALLTTAGRPVVLWKAGGSSGTEVALANGSDPQSASDWSRYAIPGTNLPGSIVLHAGGEQFISGDTSGVLHLKTAPPVSAADWELLPTPTGRVTTPPMVCADRLTVAYLWGTSVAISTANVPIPQNVGDWSSTGFELGGYEIFAEDIALLVSKGDQGIVVNWGSYECSGLGYPGALVLFTSGPTGWESYDFPRSSDECVWDTQLRTYQSMDETIWHFFHVDFGAGGYEDWSGSHNGYFLGGVSFTAGPPAPGHYKTPNFAAVAGRPAVVGWADTGPSGSPQAFLSLQRGSSSSPTQFDQQLQLLPQSTAFASTPPASVADLNGNVAIAYSNPPAHTLEFGLEQHGW